MQNVISIEHSVLNSQDPKMDPLPALREFVSAGKLKEVELQSDGSYRQEKPSTYTRCTAMPNAKRSLQIW